jgi:diphosphomevalonate decarboxylase
MLDYINPRLVVETSRLTAGKITWKSPSNIAIIKYWGKHGKQLPNNPSVSFTLDQAFTETTLEYFEKPKSHDGTISLEFFFEKVPNEAFRKKVVTFLESIVDIFPFLKQLHFIIHSYNSFPHSSGIASSASSMSALTLCLCSLEDLFFGTLEKKEDFFKKASFVARLGSGSASRSVYPTMAAWGESGEIKGSSDLFAIPFEDQINAVFKTYHDDILIVSKGEKSVSSRAGHSLMDGNIYAANRYQQARQRLHHLLIALKTGDLDLFGNIAENEALTLHALMMTSSPSYLLMRPNTIKLIEMVRNFREDTKLPLYFSLDAGPNLHLLYPDNNAEKIQSFIKSELLQYCENNEFIEDNAGPGPMNL